MKKKLIQKDLSKIVKSKFVRLILGTDNQFTSANRWFFTNDGQLDDKIIVGVQLHTGHVNAGPLLPGEDIPATVFYNVVTGYADFYYNPTLYAAGTNFVQSSAFLSLVNAQNRYFWYQQPLSSLSVANTGKYYKRMYSKIKLDKCYIESPITLNFGAPNVPVTYYVPFTFYYLDDPNL